MNSKAAFVSRFLAIFALVILLGWATGATTRYAQGLQAATALLSPVTSGWWLEVRGAETRPTLWYRDGTRELRLLLSLEALALGLLPLLALLGATPGLGGKRLLISAAIGVTVLFSLDLLILLLYPFLVGSPGPLTDIAGSFLGLLTFVGGPVILWFALTYDRLRGVWKLEGIQRKDHHDSTKVRRHET